MKATHKAPSNLSVPMQAFWVGHFEVYAAYNREEALELANAGYGGTCFRLSDVRPCAAATLHGPAYSPAGERLGTLWQQVALLCAPGYLCASSP